MLRAPFISRSDDSHIEGGVKVLGITYFLSIPLNMLNISMKTAEVVR